MHFRHIPRDKTPPDGSVDSAILVPRLLPGETVQGFLTATYNPQRVHTDVFKRQTFSRVSLQQLLYVYWKRHETTNAWFEQERQHLGFFGNTRRECDADLTRPIYRRYIS